MKQNAKIWKIIIISRNVLSQMESYTHYAKEKKKNVMIAVFMRILKNTILHIQRNKKASL